MSEPIRQQSTFSSLRVRVLVALIVPMLVMLGVILALEYAHTMELINSQAKDNAENIARLQIAAMRHAMDTHDLNMLEEITRSTITLNQIQRTLLIGETGVVWDDNLNRLEGQRFALGDEDCAICHAAPLGLVPALEARNLPGQDVLRVASVIENSPDCQVCHTANLGHVGILVLDVSLENPSQVARSSILRNALVASSLLAVISALLYFQIDRLVVRRIRKLLRPLGALDAQDFSIRLPISSAQDELDRLADSFNGALSRIEKQIEDENKHQSELQEIIITERERIARELHDNLPQLLAYFNTKIGAITLLLQNGQQELALENLAQLETASRQSLTDVREAIMGLRASRFVTSGLGLSIRRFIELFKEICTIEILLNIDPRCDALSSEPEIEIQSLRIVQEALSNVRRHARATRVEIAARCDDDRMQITIRDDGVGFDLSTLAALEKTHYGLAIMRERAETHGGTFMLESEPGKGTTIQVTFPINQPAHGGTGANPGR